jgi:DNA-directed RNA polymerase subunit RPC12/RpoP
MNEKQVEALRVIGGDSLVNHVIEAQERLMDIWKSHMEFDVETKNTSSQPTKSTCKNCGATLVICALRSLECEYCGTRYFVGGDGDLEVKDLGITEDSTPRAVVNIAKQISSGSITIHELISMDMCWEHYLELERRARRLGTRLRILEAVIL